MMSNAANKNIARLPSLYNKDKTSNNYKLFQIDGTEKDDLIQTLLDIQNSRYINTAFGQSLDRLGENIGQKRGQLQDLRYRLLLKARQKINLSSGTVNEIIEILATVFSVDRTEIEINETFDGTFKFSSSDSPEQNTETGFNTGTLSGDYESGNMLVSIPPGAVTSVGFPRQWVLELLDSISASGVKTELNNKGTFKFSNSDSPEYDVDTGFDIGTLGAYYDPPEQPQLPI